MPVDLLAFASVFTNSLLTMLASVMCGYLTFKAFLRPRHSLALFFGFFLLKMVTISLFDMLGFLGIASGDVSALGEALIALFGLCVYIVLYYSWDTSFEKVALFGIMADLLTGIALAISFSICSWASTGQVTFGYVGYFEPTSFVRPVLVVAVFWVLLQVIKPIGRVFAEHDFKHRFPLLALVLVNVVVSVTSRLTAPADSLGLLYGPLFLTFFLVPVLALFVVFEWRRVRARRNYLEQSKAIMAACDEALRSQSAFLAQSRAELDGLSARIERVEAQESRGDLQQHLDSLLSVCDHLRFGTYSDNPALDVVLLSYERRFAEVGLPVKYHISPLGDGREQVALAAQSLLDWALQACIRGIVGFAREEGAGSSPGMYFRAFRHADRLFLEAKVFAGGKRIPHMRQSDRVPIMGNLVDERREGNTLAIRMLVGEKAA